MLQYLLTKVELNRLQYRDGWGLFNRGYYCQPPSVLLEVLTLPVVVKRLFSELVPIPLVVGRAWYLGCQSLIGGLALDQVLRVVGLFWLTTSCYSIAGTLLGLVTRTAKGRLDEPSLVPSLP